MSTNPGSLSTVDWANSFYRYVRSNVQTINPERQFGGIVQARAWPLKSVQMDTFYLLLGQLDPIRTIKGWYAPWYGEKIQWVWQIQGTDVSDNIAANRGDRYMIHHQMIQELLAGMFPGFCEKYSWTVGTDSNGNPILVSTSFNPVEMVWYDKPSFADKYDSSNGILTGAALSSIYSFGPTLGQTT